MRAGRESASSKGWEEIRCARQGGRVHGAVEEEMDTERLSSFWIYRSIMLQVVRVHTLSLGISSSPLITHDDTVPHLGAHRPNPTPPRPHRPRRYPETHTGSRSTPVHPARTTLSTRARPCCTRTRSALRRVLGRLKLVRLAGREASAPGRDVGEHLRRPIYWSYKLWHSGEKRMGTTGKAVMRQTYAVLGHLQRAAEAFS